MTATAGHVITVTELGGELDDTLRSVRVTCSCGGYDVSNIPATLAGLYGQTHIDRMTRPAVARAQDIASAIRDGRITAEQADQLAQVLLCAADIADRVSVVQRRGYALDTLVKLVRGEA